MQYPVPQFTDVEDKIIGSLTIKQFGIIFGAGAVVFMFYSLTKSIPITIFVGLLVGLPALGIAFAKINGRPMYNFISHFVDFLISPKVLVFHKEAHNMTSQTKLTSVEIAKPAAAEIKPAGDTQSRIKEISQILEKQREEEKELVKSI